MSRPPDYIYRMSEKLSEVMDDIGVNERLVMKRRRSYNLRETLLNFQEPFFSTTSTSCTTFIFGSQNEGSTTKGLDSDTDFLYSVDDVNVIQHMGEWKPGSIMTVMMIQNENISPGYCHLQAVRSDIPLPAPANFMKTIKDKAIDSEGRILWMRNRLLDITTFPEHSPAKKSHNPGEQKMDLVPCYCCKSSPLQAAPWLQKLTKSKWPSEDDKTFCRNAGCFLVLVGSKLSDMPKYECRISTSLQERCLMFSLTITHLRCYVLMKMILKTHIHPYVDDVLSSFMCKNVLLYCVYNSSHASSQEWYTGNLLSYLHLCLFMLKERILQRNCPHLMIPGNNLLAGRMKEAQRGKLLDIIDNLMESKEELLCKIQIDDLGTRLMMKLNLVASSPELPSATNIATGFSGNMIINIAAAQSNYEKLVLMKMYNENLEVTQQNMSELLSDLKKDRAEGNSRQQNACDLLIPLVKSALGSVMASISIDAQKAISDQTFTYLEAGKESDVLSGRLKLVSVLYCTGDIKRTECELKISRKKYNRSIVQQKQYNRSIVRQKKYNRSIVRQKQYNRSIVRQKQYNRSIVQSVCACFRNERVFKKFRHFKACEDQNEEAIKFLVAFCTRFLNNEINCVPHELRYEILKSYIEEDRKMRTEEDSRWMDYSIAVDSVPYLYFLQYKTYGRLKRRTEQQEALFNLVRNVEIHPDLNHTETTLNLIGQCFEQENLHAEAFLCYIRSLQHRERNNAARFLMCIQLSKLWKKYKV